ncbi:MAG: sugar phosphate isomerase/epimerase [Bryobacterales bacterium]|nr:sugar phosphate isomerase/epimerase [Bryobacterales bacterium]
MTRRKLMGGAACGAAALGFPRGAAQAGGRSSRIRLAVSTYSYWHLRGEKYPIEKVLEHAAELGFDGVEILHRQMTSEEPAYLNKLKQMAFRLGLALPMLSIHQDFVEPDHAKRKENVDHTVRCIELARQMGIPSIRLNSGRWNTIPSFDDLMKVKGNEPPIAGYTDKDAIAWCVESIRQCLPAAEKAGVLLALENHWGLTTSVETLLAIHGAVKSPWLGINLDTGNFPENPYAGIEKMAPHASIIQAKTYHGGGVWYTLDLDYKKIAGIVKRAGYQGWVSLEMEGNENPATAVPKSLRTLREAFLA